MNRFQRRSLLVVPAAAALAIAALGAAPAQAAPVGFSVSITAHTDFLLEAAPFTSNLPGCATGTVVNGAGGGNGTPWGGVFVGTKSFTCAGGTSGFDISLRARFGGGGSTGSWVLAGAWGDLAGVKGSGSLVGIPVSDTAIDDIYTGKLR